MTQKIRFMTLLLIVAIPFAAFAAEPVGRQNGGGSSMDWQLNATGHEKATLTWSGPDGEVGQIEFPNGKHVSLHVRDLGTEVVDGQYTWELRLSPKVSKDVSKKLEAARAANDEKAARKIMKDAGFDPEAMSMSGAFVVQNGAFVSTEGSEGSASSSARRVITTNAARPSAPIAVNDQVIPDDLIVQGSICAGFDCVNGESFGFDTLRLKENNTRIKFEDTSVGSFPTNDWQLTANDSASGGASKFSIEDITGAKVPVTVTAGAATNSVFVDSTGRVGFRTATPVLDLHVSTSNTPAIRLEQTNAGGFTAQTWDIGANEANFFVRDVTGGSRLSFRIRPGAPTSSIDISADGDVGVGTASPDEKLHVEESVDENTFALVENTNSTGLSAAAVVRTKADVATLNFQAHGSARTLTRFGQTLGGWSEILQVAGGTNDGLIVGTLGANDLILGTNSAARLTINGSTGAVTIPGNLTVTGVKNFAVVDPADETKALYYTALEGPEAGTYFRGTAKTVDGEVVIELPGYFSRITENERMTVQLTPVGAPGQLYIASKSPEKLVIKVANGGTDLEFDYLVQGVRKGYLDYQVERADAFPVVQK